jgi:hypothetical protein
MRTKSTPVYARQHSRSPTLPQLNAVDLLAAGKTDTEAAELLSLDRTTVTKWRLYDPVFQAALNRRRAEVWSCGVDRLRSLIPKALDALADALEDRDHPHRVKAAAELLRLVPLADGALAIGPTDADDVVRRVVEERRRTARGPLHALLEDGRKGLPPYEDHVEAIWRELEAKAADPASEAVPAAVEQSGGR